MTTIALSDVLAGEYTGRVPTTPCIGVVHGEGIGPSIIDGALRVCQAAARVAGVDVEIVTADEGLVSNGLSAEASDFYRAHFEAGVPVLHGPVGGRFVYDLRREFDLFVKVTPVETRAEIADATIVRPERATGVDLAILRDNVAGLYQGSIGVRDGGDTAFQEAIYRRSDVTRLVDAAARLAASRNGRMTVVTKPGGVPTISALWRDAVTSRVAERGADIEVDFLDIDNACFQMLADPRRFDVVLTPNMFGDVLGDTAAVLLGSRGMSYSANFGIDGRAVYQTAHGAAYDLAGTDRANPVAQILTLAWMARSSLGLETVANLMDGAVNRTLAAGFRTADISGAASTVVGTVEMCDLIVAQIESAPAL